MASRYKKKPKTMKEVLCETADTLLPPERMSVSECAERHRLLNNPGSYVGPWRNDKTPYLIEPMDILTSLDYKAMIFVGPAQSGKTDMFLNWLVHSALYDLSDMMLVQMSQKAAGLFSQTRIDRMHRENPDVMARLVQGKNSDNIFTKHYRGGMLVDFSWPTISNFSSRPIRRVWLTDLDRYPLNIDGEGSAFHLARGRTKSFRSNGMCVAESSPGFAVLDPQWSKGDEAHKAPPCEGILSLYNEGDRRRWYWLCENCKVGFEPHFKLLRTLDLPDINDRAKSVWMECPHCSVQYRHNGVIDGNTNMPSKAEMNKKGVWLKEGQTLDSDGNIIGEGLERDTASFHLNGAAATFQNWQELMKNYLSARAEYEATGDEGPLKTTTNIDQGSPYTYVASEGYRLPHEMMARAKPFHKRQVPMGARFLVASVDQQKYKFVVQVHAVGVGNDIWVVDRFDIKHSRRIDESREGQVHRARPFEYKEDWRLLLSEVLAKKYPLSGDSSRVMPIMMTICDSGGEKGATSNAYEFWRWLRYGPKESDIDSLDWPEWTPDLYNRFLLYKGRDTGQRTIITYPDSPQAGSAKAYGEIPVLMTNTNDVKNLLDIILLRDLPGSGMVHFPDWLELDFYRELCAETKDHKGKWHNPNRARNETWDCFVMALAIMLEPTRIGIERIVDWDNPPWFALPWDKNTLIEDADQERGIDLGQNSGISVAELAKQHG